ENFRAIGTNGFASKNHLAVFEFADKIEITAVVVNPGLLPLCSGRHKGRNAHTTQGHGRAAGELLFNHASAHDALDAIASMDGVSRFFPWPCEIPLANPKIELLLLRLSAGLCRRLGSIAVLPTLGRESKHQ